MEEKNVMLRPQIFQFDFTRYDNKVDRCIFKTLKRNASLTCAELCKLLRSYCDRRVGFATTWMHLEKLCEPSIGIVKKRKDSTRWWGSWWGQIQISLVTKGVMR
jgi:hypothetical protein